MEQLEHVCEQDRGHVDRSLPLLLVSCRELHGGLVDQSEYIAHSLLHVHLPYCQHLRIFFLDLELENVDFGGLFRRDMGFWVSVILAVSPLSDLVGTLDSPA